MVSESDDPTLAASGPALPSARIYFLLALILALMAGMFIDWAHGRFQLPAEQARVFATWTGLSLAANLAGFAFVPLAHRLRDRVPACRTGIAAWIVVYGGFALSQAVVMVGRSVLGNRWFPEVFTRDASVVAVLNGFMVTMLLFALAERSAAGERDSLDHKARLHRLSEELSHSRVQMVVDDDRIRAEVARMLHGELQTLLLLSWAELGEAMAARAEDRTAGESKLRQVEQWLGQANETLDSGLAGWLSSVEESSDLCAALRQLAASFAPVLSVSVEIDSRMREHRTALPPAAARAALLLVQEALLNALKHARAHEVRVVGESDPAGGFTLRVEDHGRGFGSSRAQRGLGFSVLGKELVAHGGAWKVESSPGRGTCLQVSVPAEGIQA